MEKNNTFSYGLYAVTIFLSSFLLFSVQPLLGKHILPWYGGSSAVWITALFFFTVVLGVGYMYALVLGKFSVRTQAVMHSIFLLGGVGVVVTHTLQWPSGITPAITDVGRSVAAPAQAVFETLSIIIGIPFLLLAATSSLLQLWYGRLSGAEPFSLYSISNIGSLLGLLSYPLLVEPFLSTVLQGTVWSGVFFLYAGLMLSCVYVFVRHTREVQLSAVLSTTVPWRQYLAWTAVAAVPVIVMLTGTVFMSTAIAPVPFLWVGPLALYLGSFIYTFRSGGVLSRLFNELLVLSTALCAVAFVVFSSVHVFVTIAVMHAAMFALYHWCHEYLYRTRPEVAKLGHFYVALSLGGIIGSVLVKVVSLYVLSVPIELMLIISTALVVILVGWLKDSTFALPRFDRTKTRAVAGYLLFSVLLITVIYIAERYDNTTARERNFFGYKAVVDTVVTASTTVRSLQHGLTNHGSIVVVDGMQQIAPTSYYTNTSGVGKVFSVLQSREVDGLAVAVMGLGSGGLAAYCRENDTFNFYEIDSEVRDMAYQYFTYLDTCRNHTVTIEDARLALTEQARRGTQYDVIIMDAYADDMAPIHLLTSEAMAVYADLIPEDGVIAMHISSRYLNLLPVMKSLAESNNLVVRQIFDEKPVTPQAFPSHWVLFSPSVATFDDPIFNDLQLIADDVPLVRWTDTHSALLPVIRW